MSMSATKNPRVPEQFNFKTRADLVHKEFAECAEFLQEVGMRGNFIFFGSARARNMSQIEEERAQLTKRLSEPNLDENERVKLEAQMASWKRKEWMAPVWDATATLAKLLTEWSISTEGQQVGQHVWSLLPGGCDQQPLMCMHGGGPGFMEACAFGAAQVPGAKNIGIGVKLPFEAKLNEHCSEGITVNSFYARKYWEVFAMKAMIVCPGGMGSLDEMFEVLTLIQCKHCPKVPVVLLGRDFWNGAINFKFLAEREVVSKEEVDALLITDDPNEAFQFIVGAMRSEAERLASAPSSPKPERLPTGQRSAGGSGFDNQEDNNDNNQNNNTATAAASGTTPPAPPFRRDREKGGNQDDAQK